MAVVDDLWFAHARPGPVLGVPVRLCPPEEMIWSKAFIMERERYDGADVAHLIQACGRELDWRRLLGRFGRHWRVLLSHLILFGFIYPGERAMRSRRGDGRPPAPARPGAGRPAEDARVCDGTLLSRQQYLVDIDARGYADGRLAPRGEMTAADIAHWTAAIPPGPEPAPPDACRLPSPRTGVPAPRARRRRR